VVNYLLENYGNNDVNIKIPVSTMITCRSLSLKFIFIPFVNPDSYTVSCDWLKTFIVRLVDPHSTHGLMIVCGIKTGDQELLVMVWILTGTIMITGMITGMRLVELRFLISEEVFCKRVGALVTRDLSWYCTRI